MSYIIEGRVWPDGWFRRYDGGEGCRHGTHGMYGFQVLVSICMPARKGARIVVRHACGTDAGNRVCARLLPSCCETPAIFKLGNIALPTYTAVRSMAPGRAAHHTVVRAGAQLLEREISEGTCDAYPVASASSVANEHSFMRCTPFYTHSCATP